MDGMESWLDEKIKQSFELLKALKNEGEISDDFFAEASNWVEDLANQIRLSYIAAKPLIETDDIKSLDELLLPKQKAVGELDIFHQMASIIKEYSKRTRIQKRAIDEILAGRTEACMPPLEKDGFIPVNWLYDTSTFLETFHPIIWKRQDGMGFRLFLTDNDDVALTFIDDCILACGSLYRYVSRLRKVPDPADDWFKEPHQTMLNGGDCDDLAILYCTLARSISLSTYLAFQPNHVYPGVFVKTCVELNKEELPSDVRNGERVKEAKQVYEIIETKIPADPTIPMPLIVLNMQGSTYVFTFFGLHTIIFQSLYNRLPDADRKNLESTFKMIDEGLKKAMNPEPHIYFI